MDPPRQTFPAARALFARHARPGAGTVRTGGSAPREPPTGALPPVDPPARYPLVRAVTGSGARRTTAVGSLPYGTHLRFSGQSGVEPPTDQLVMSLVAKLAQAAPRKTVM